MLAASHAIGINAVIEEEVAEFLAQLLLKRYPHLLAARYRFKLDDVERMDGYAVLENVAQQRGLKLKGGVLDIPKAAHVLLQDYRSGALGRVSLETPDSREHLIAEAQTSPSSTISLQDESGSAS